MTTDRMETFSDGVIAILITIMVLQLPLPAGADWSALRPVVPDLLAYLLSFVFLGIYWNNHHHMLHLTARVNGAILWANLLLLFWLSLVPFCTHWLADRPAAQIPTACYGIVLLLAGCSYYGLQILIIHDQGGHSPLREAIGGDWKGKLSPLLYLLAIGLAFARPWLADAIFVLVAGIWLVPDRRIEAYIAGHAGR